MLCVFSGGGSLLPGAFMASTLCSQGAGGGGDRAVLLGPPPLPPCSDFLSCGSQGLPVLSGCLSSFLFYLSTSYSKCLDCFCSRKLRQRPSREPLGLVIVASQKGPARFWASQGREAAMFLDLTSAPSSTFPHSRAFSLQITESWLLRRSCQKTQEAQFNLNFR